MEEPKLKREVAVRWYSATMSVIEIYATEDAASDFRKYGNLDKDAIRPNGWHLVVDSRFDFNEVLAYIKNYG